MNRLSAIVFDLDQTLFDRQLAFDAWVSSLALCNWDQSHLRFLDQNGYGNRERFFAAFHSFTGSRIDHRSFVRSLIRHMSSDRSLISCLTRIKEMYSIAILTNGGTWTQHAKIQTLSLDEVFPPERIFVSEQIGFAKPDRRAFDLVAGVLGVPASECLYLGDSVQTDVEAARGAGWMAQNIRGPSELMQQMVQLREFVAC